MNIEKIASTFQLVGSRILKVSIDNSFFEITNSIPAKKTIDVNYEILSISREEESIYGVMKLYIKSKISTKSKDENEVGPRKYKFDLVIEGCFTDTLEIDDKKFESYLRINGSAALYSIARGFILGTSAQTLLSGQVMLPMANFVQMEELKKDE